MPFGSRARIYSGPAPLSEIVLDELSASYVKLPVAGHVIGLLGFSLLPVSQLQEPDMSALSAALRELLCFVQVLRLTNSGSALELLPHCVLKLRQLDMCDLMIEHKYLNFLDANKKSIRCSLSSLGRWYRPCLNR